MTEKSSNNETRSKLTLKLPTSTVSGNLSKSTISKKIPNSVVEVTIKNKRKVLSSNKNEEKSLNSSELKARANAISSKSSEEKDEIQNHEVLIKLKREKSQTQIVEKSSKVVKKNKDLEDSKDEIILKKQDLSQEKTAENEKSENIQNFESDYQNSRSEPIENLSNSIVADEFDVRSKIKKSVEIANQQKLERERMLEERKKQEKRKLDEESAKKLAAEIESKKKLKKNYDDAESEEKSSEKKWQNKDIKNVQKKQTYLFESADSDEDGSSYRKRRRFKPKNVISQDAQKEYKKISRDVILPDLITVSELAERMSEKAGDVVKKLFSMGMVVTSNQAIDCETAEIIVVEFGHSAKRVSHSDVENVLNENEESGELMPRAPVVTIMGHVDHGKTSLLDALRETDVVSGEHGGITQHIGASRIKTKEGKFITFLDTPGHEAFTEMRARGANTTDIVVLVVAADDGVKEQTVEAIHHAKAANVPIIVAVNKIDKPGANPNVVKNELLSHELVAEDMGGDVIFVPVSAKAKTNLEKLEEAILLQAEVLDLKAPIEGKSSGVVLEARIDQSRGVVATVLVQRGTLDISDLIVVGTSYGRVRKMSDHNGKSMIQATPSMPVEIFGLDYVPNAGDKFVEVSEDRQAREIIAYRARQEKDKKALKNSAKSINDIFRESGKERLKYLNIIVKSDVHGSLEAILGTISKITSDEVAIKIIHSATGGITESDVSLAAVSGSIIIGFNVRANPATKDSANQKGVLMHYYSIIYNLVDDLKMMLSGLLNPSRSEEMLGTAQVRQIFKVSNIGKVAGCIVSEGVIKRNARARLLRDNVVIHDGELKTLKRFKDDVKEVKSGFECGIAFENYDDLKEKDVIECYEIIEKKRTI